MGTEGWQVCVWRRGPHAAGGLGRHRLCQYLPAGHSQNLPLPKPTIIIGFIIMGFMPMFIMPCRPKSNSNKGWV
jgi:hypothetical protein